MRDPGYDITEDIAVFMSAYVDWVTEPAPAGEWTHITEEAAQEAFMSFVHRVMAEAWAEGYDIGMCDEALGDATENPYDPEEK